MKTDTALDVGWCEEVIITIDVYEGADNSLEDFDTSEELVGVGIGNGIHTDCHCREDKCLGLRPLGAFLQLGPVINTGHVPRKWHLVSPNGYCQRCC